MNEATQLLSRIQQGDPSAADQLLPLVYGELRKLAAAKLADEKPGQTLQATALVHAAYLRLIDGDASQHWNSRGHFFGAAATAMRRILVDIARKKKSQKRAHERVHLDQLDGVFRSEPRIEDFVELEEVLQRLEARDQRAAKLVELRVFAGMTIDESATQLEISARSATRYWAYAKAWLRRELVKIDSETDA